MPSSFLQAIKNDVVDLQAYGKDKTIVEEWWDEYGYDSPTLRTIYTGDTDIVPHRDKIQNKLEKMTLPFRPSDNLSVLQTQLHMLLIIMTRIILPQPQLILVLIILGIPKRFMRGATQKFRAPWCPNQH